MRTSKNVALSKTKRNLRRGDEARDVNVEGDSIEEVAHFFMELFGGSSKKTHIRRESKHAL
ncbi:hypothetical protein [Vibrio cholerae]|uniref:hypothetical protein n=1 Tax=Vibrio cholerae TaxID=666 RepID=UPI0029C1D68E|nr:hypothetical protein [Vibrio cholerae]MDX5049140.1 hypothetical protein [Vibrio cholerae]